MDLPNIGTYTYGDKTYTLKPAALKQVRAFRAAEDPEEGVLVLVSEVTGAPREEIEGLPPGVVNAIALAAINAEGATGNFTPVSGTAS